VICQTPESNSLEFAFRHDNRHVGAHPLESAARDIGLVWTSERLDIFLAVLERTISLWHAWRVIEADSILTDPIRAPWIKIWDDDSFSIRAPLKHKPAIGVIYATYGGKVGKFPSDPSGGQSLIVLFVQSMAEGWASKWGAHNFLSWDAGFGST
jgi:hypothetical protein